MRIPESHADILEKPVRAVLSTFEPGGGLRSNLCTCLGEGDSLLITSVDPAQVRQIELNPKVSMLVMDPRNVDRWLCVQGDASVPGGAACKVSIRRVMVFPM
jgi:general stress protein 26